MTKFEILKLIMIRKVSVCVCVRERERERERERLGRRTAKEII